MSAALLIVSALMASGLDDSDSTTPIGGLVERVLSARREIVTGDVTYQVQRDQNEDPSNREFRAIFDYGNGKRWLRVDSARNDVQMKVGDKNVAVLSHDGKHVDRIVVKDEEFIHYSPDEFSDGTRIAVTTSRLQNERQKYRDMVVDPLVIGMVAESFGHLPSNSINGLLDVSKMQNAVLEDADDPTAQRGPRLAKIKFQNEWGSRVTLSISGAQGNSLIHAQIDHSDKDGLMSSVMEAQMRQFPDADLWFPELITFTRSVAGKEVMRERITVTKARFNQAIDPNDFSVAALDVRPGTEVITLAEERPPDRVWDGEKVVEVKPLAKAPTEQPERRSNLMFMLAVNFAVLAIIAAIFFARSRSRKSP